MTDEPNVKLDINAIYNKPPKKTGFIRTANHFLQAVTAFSLLFTLRILPLDFTSWLGGFAAKKIGPLLKEHKVALMNLHLAFPEKSYNELNEIALGEWENIGRTLGEYPHISRTDVFLKRMTFHNRQYLDDFFSDDKGGLFLSAHFGNWELGPCLTETTGKPFTFIYRSPNNPFMEKVFRFRTKGHTAKLIPKNKHSMLKLIRAINNKEFAAMMIDQKLNEGVAVKFFGKTAMTTPSPAIIASRYGCPVLMLRIKRIPHSARFDIILEKPIRFTNKHPSEQEIMEITQNFNDTLEKWVKENPDQWLWIHKRWNKDVFETEQTELK